MKLKFWGDENKETAAKTKDESDAMRGKYRLQALDWRMRQHLANEIIGEPTTVKGPDGKDTETEGEEHWLDTEQRQLSVTTTGQGALGKDYPITPKNRLARERLLAISRYADLELKKGNRLRTFMTRHMKDSHHTVFDRSVEFDEPEVVLTYKPMLYPGPTEQPTNANEQEEQARKKP